MNRIRNALVVERARAKQEPYVGSLLVDELARAKQEPYVRSLLVDELARAKQEPPVHSPLAVVKDLRLHLVRRNDETQGLCEANIADHECLRSCCILEM